MNSGQAVMTPQPAGLSLKRKLLFSLVLVVLAWLTAELLFRVVGYNFEDPRRGLQLVPPFYRIPTEPVGTFAYHRPGNIHWQGQPLKTQLGLQGFDDSDYDSEVEVHVEYDRDGFRNSCDLQDWSIVFVGDSFTELGHLPREQLFTAIVAAESGRPVKNLGTSYTGPFTHSVYLAEYGISPGSRDAVLVFFEGNDLDDLVGEEILRARAQRPGFKHENLLDQAAEQRSLTVALVNFVRALPASRSGSAANATYQAAGVRHRVTVSYAPAEMVVGQRRWDLVIQALDNWVEVCKKNKIRPWFLYMPCKYRVLHAFLQLDRTAHPALRSWQPGPLGDQLSRLCETRQLTFLDATAVLQRSAAAGEIPYNTVFDTHLNERGSRLVAELLIGRISD